VYSLKGPLEGKRGGKPCVEALGRAHRGPRPGRKKKKKRLPYLITHRCTERRRKSPGKKERHLTSGRFGDFEKKKRAAKKK